MRHKFWEIESDGWKRGRGWQLRVSKDFVRALRPRLDPWNLVRGALPALAAFFVVLLVAGCAGPKVEYVPFEVQVPVPVPCAAALPKEPEWATGKLRKSDTLDTKAKELLAEREQRKGYEEKLKAATDGCR